MPSVAKRPPGSRAIVISANTSWNIVNFRLGLIEALIDHGYWPVIIAPADRHTETIIARGLEYHDLPMSRSGMNPAADAILLARYYRLIRRSGAIAFLGFTIKPNIYGSIAARLAGVERINNVSGLGTAFLERPMLEWFVARLYRRAFRHSHTVFFQNDDDRRLFVEKGLVEASRAALLPGSGVDLERFQPVRAEPAAAPTFLFVGRLLGDKGIREYVEAARLLRSDLPDARFQILGDLDPDNRTGVQEEELQSWTAEGCVEYLGSADDIRPFIAGATAVVLPSYREGMPRALLEASAMGKPLVAADAPGSRDIVLDGITGFLCRARDSRSLAGAVRKMAELPVEEREALGRAALEKVRREFSETVVIDRYLAAIRTGTASAKAARA